MRATWSLICSRRRAGVAGKVAIWSKARVSCAIASTNAERSSDRCPALPHRPAAFSMRAASVFAYLADDTVGFIGATAVMHQDLRTGGGECQRAGAADTAGGAGDESRFS